MHAPEQKNKKASFPFRRESFLCMHVEIHSVRLLALLCLLGCVIGSCMHACMYICMSEIFMIGCLFFFFFLSICLLACLPTWLVRLLVCLFRLSDGLVHARLTCIACMNERLASFRADVCFCLRPLRWCGVVWLASCS